MSNNKGLKTIFHQVQNNTLIKKLGLVLFIVFVVVLTELAIRYVFPPESEKTMKQEKSVEKKMVVNPKPLEEENLPEVAIIIDDMGNSLSIAKKWAALDADFTFAILPQSPHKRVVAQLAEENGIEVLLHLPMEPVDYPRVKPGPGGLLMSMDDDSIKDVIENDLNSIPNIVGVNNHMGSRMTESTDKMDQVLRILKKRGLFFVDSKTSPRSVCRSVAEKIDIPFVERDIFLDNVLARNAIRNQLGNLVREAEKNGRAIAICHPHQETYETLADEYAWMSERVKFVHISEFVL